MAKVAEPTVALTQAVEATQAAAMLVGTLEDEAKPEEALLVVTKVVAAKASAAKPVVEQTVEASKAASTEAELMAEKPVAATQVVKAVWAAARAATGMSAAAVRATHMNATSTSDGVCTDSRCRTAAHTAQVQSPGTWRAPPSVYAA